MFPENPNTELYTLGKGVLQIAEWSGGAPGEYRDVGNSPKFEAEIAVEKLSHYSSRSGAKSKDKTATIERGYTINFDLDEKSAKNLAMFLMGEQDGNTVHALTQTDAEYAVKFKADNPVGPNDIWEFWRCNISPGGAVSLIGDEWLTMSYTGEGLSDVANHPSSPYFDVTGTTTTTTTSSTTTTTAT
jgi:hypothetical protein